MPQTMCDRREFVASSWSIDPCRTKGAPSL